MQTRKTTLGAVVGLALTVMAAPAAADPPLIASAEVGADGSLVLAGVNFELPPANSGGPGSVTDAANTILASARVSLALTPLTVTATSATSVTAALPETLAAGTYLVVLTRGDGQMAVSYLTTGEIGPQGSAGASGPAGPGGRKGMPGAVGPAGPGGAATRFTARTDSRGNLAFGLEALHALMTGEASVALGTAAMRSARLGYLTVAVGGSALRAGGAPLGATVVGFEAAVGRGTSNIGIGSGAGRDAVLGTNNAYIGHSGVATETGVIRIGSPNVHTQTHLPGTVTAPAFVGDGSALTNVRAVYQ